METINYYGYSSMDSYCKAPLRINCSIGRYKNSRLLLILLLLFQKLLVEWDFHVVENYMVWHGCTLPGVRESILRLVIQPTLQQEVLAWVHGDDLGQQHHTYTTRQRLLCSVY